MNESRLMIWPGATKWWLLGLILGLLSGLVVYRVGWYGTAPFAQQFYFRQYVRGTMPKVPSLAELLHNKQPDDRARILVLDDNLTSAHYEYLPAGEFHAFLKKWVYEDKTLGELLSWPIAVMFILCAVGVLVGGYADFRHNMRAREGMVLEGPRIVTRWGFNRRFKGDA